MIQGGKVAWREVRSIVIGLLVTLLVAILLGRKWLMALASGLLLGTCYFFRDPERTPDNERAESILAPADGVVQKIEVIDDPHFFHSEATRITIFLSLFNVHVQRMPYGGQIRYLHYQPGTFAPAFAQHADENEANFMGIETERGPLMVTQISGLLARRIVCWPQVGEHLNRGQRFGLIKFGSRVDLYLPKECEVIVEQRQTVAGGQTAIARWPSE